MAIKNDSNGNCIIAVTTNVEPKQNANIGNERFEDERQTEQQNKAVTVSATKMVDYILVLETN